MAARKRKYDAEQMRGLVDAWKTSGMTQRAFCEQRDINVATFSWWKGRLDHAAAVVAKQDRPRLVEIVRDQPPTPTVDTDRRQVRLETPSGVVVHFKAHLDDPKLADLIAAVNAAC